MSITFPDSPSDGDTFTWGGTTYTYDSTPGLWIGSGAAPARAQGGGVFTVQRGAVNGTNDPSALVSTFDANYSTTYLFLLIGGGGRGLGSGASVIHSENIDEGTEVTISVGGGGDNSAVPGSNVGVDSSVSIGGSVIALAAGGGSTSTNIGNALIAPSNPLVAPAVSVNATAVTDQWTILGGGALFSQGRDQGTGVSNAIGGRISYTAVV